MAAVTSFVGCVAVSRAARALIRRPNTVLGSDSPRLAPPAPRSQPRPCARARRSARWLSAAPTPPAAARQVALFLPRACPEWVFALEGSRGHRMACRCRRRASPGLGWPARAAALPNARSGRRSQALFADIMMRLKQTLSAQRRCPLGAQAAARRSAAPAVRQASASDAISWPWQDADAAFPHAQALGLAALSAVFFAAPKAQAALTEDLLARTAANKVRTAACVLRRGTHADRCAFLAGAERLQAPGHLGRQLRPQPHRDRRHMRIPQQRKRPHCFACLVRVLTPRRNRRWWAARTPPRPAP